jgi:photosystem II stability/assembly factor-like uncharacterized protein
VACVVVAAIAIAPIVVLRSGHHRVQVTNPDATTVPVVVPPVTKPRPTTPTTPTTVKSTPLTSVAPTSTGPVAAGALTPERIRLVGPGHAWVVADGPRLTVLRTVDDGAHWVDVTPPSDLVGTGGPVAGFTAGDDNHAILALPPSGNATTGARLYTTDGGATWKPSTTVGAYGEQYFSFLGNELGWSETSEGAAMGSEAVDILRTRDGGATWEVMSRGQSLDGQTAASPGALSTGCDKTGIGFGRDTTGFATGACNSSGYYFYVTHDAGRTWQPAQLPRPPSVTSDDVTRGAWNTLLEPPVFDGARGAGLVESSLSTSPASFTHHDYIYETADGGAQWTLVDPPLRGATWAWAAGATDWWAGDATTLVHTADAGTHWATLPSPGLIVDTPSLDALQFTTADSGWALVASSDGVPRIVRTTDGGRSWHPVALPHIP